MEDVRQPEVPMLVVYEGESIGQRWLIESDGALIGRGSDCDIVLPDRQVSRYHARIERTAGGAYALRDLGSKNRTYLNGEELAAEDSRVLRDGDEIQVALSTKMGFVGADATLPIKLQVAARGLQINQATHQVCVNSRKLDPPLSLAQYRLLTALADAEGRVVSREQIIDTVWADEAASGVSEQAIDALVRRLRDRLAEVDPHHTYIVTVRGHGFRFENR